MIADYLTGFDFSLPLIDAVNDPDIADVRSEIAALALEEGLDSGYYETQELAEAFLEAAKPMPGSAISIAPLASALPIFLIAVHLISAACSMRWPRCRWRTRRAISSGLRS